MGATSRDVYIDRLLSNVAMGYRPQGFIADMIFPVAPVQRQSDKYPVFSRADRLRRQNTKRARGNEARIITQDVGSDTFYCENYALKTQLFLEDRENMDPALYQQLANGRTTFLMDHLYLDWEVRVANQVTSGSNVGSYSAVSSGWTGAGADPLADLNTAIDNVQDSTGIRPNRIVMGLDAWRAFRRNSTVRNIIFGSNNGGGYPNIGQATSLLEVDQIMVGGAFQNTGDEGLAEALANVWGDSVLVYYAPPAPTVDNPSFGYSFRWSRPSIPDLQVERHPYDSKTKAEEVEAGYYQDEKITGADYGFLLTAVTSST